MEEDNNETNTFKYTHNAGSDDSTADSVDNNTDSDDNPDVPANVDDHPSGTTTNNNPPKAKKNTRGMSIASFSLAMVPVVIAIYCLIISKGQLKGGWNSSASVWFVFVLYYMSVGLPIAILSIIFGIIGVVREADHKLAIIALVIKLVTLIGFFFIAILPLITSLMK